MSDLCNENLTVLAVVEKGKRNLRFGDIGKLACFDQNSNIDLQLGNLFVPNDLAYLYRQKSKPPNRLSALITHRLSWQNIKNILH